MQVNAAVDVIAHAGLRGLTWWFSFVIQYPVECVTPVTALKFFNRCSGAVLWENSGVWWLAGFLEILPHEICHMKLDCHIKLVFSCLQIMVFIHGSWYMVHVLADSGMDGSTSIRGTGKKNWQVHGNDTFQPVVVSSLLLSWQFSFFFIFLSLFSLFLSSFLCSFFSSFSLVLLSSSLVKLMILVLINSEKVKKK